MVSLKFDDVYVKAREICSIELTKFSIRQCDREDVMQEASIKVLNSIKKYNAEKGSINTFLNRVVSSVIKDWLRSEKRDIRAINLKAIPFSELCVSCDGKDEDGDFIERIPSVDDNCVDVLESMAFIPLTDNEKKYITLSIQGYTSKEMSLMLKVSEAYVSKLKRTLKNKFKEFGLVG